jgi:N-acyl-D-amino-acid deacylase
MHQVLRGATVVDGTGGAARRADVEVRDGRITAVGAVGDRRGAAVVDLDGLVLAPGFVDIHTHYDAQVFWDPDLTPSSWHGVTTVVQGNCGFGIAPARPQDRELLMETLQLVEGMQLDTLRAGIDWRFETFPEYLDAIRARPLRINLAAFVPHSALRLYVMGADAAFGRHATDDELAEMRRLVVEALDAGAIGVSTSQAPSHVGPFGKPIPSRFADEREVRALLQAIADTGRDGIIEITYGNILEIEEVARLADEYGVRITWGSVLPGLFGGPGAAVAMLDRGTAAGRNLWPQCTTKFITLQMSLEHPYLWARVPAFGELTGRDHATMKAMYADPAWRDRARAQGKELASETNFLQNDYDGWFERTSVDETDLHAPLRGRSLADVARERGDDPFAVMLDLSIEEDLGTRFRQRPRATLEELTALVKDHRTVFGAHDAGAHVDMLCDGNYTTHTLRYWVREQGALSLEEAVWRLSGQPAELWGLTDRGVIAPGRVADLVAFDPATVGDGPLRRVHDQPAGGERLLSSSEGVVHVWVNGTPIRRDGVDLDGVRPGGVVAR